MKNPPWSRDELILALDVYFRIQPKVPGKSVTEVQQLSSTLREIARPEYTESASYRSVASVVMKLMNFRSIDPEYSGAGLKSSGHGDKEVWKEFSYRKMELSELAKRIVQFSNDNTLEKYSELTLELEEGEEGGVLTRVHLSRERNKKLVAQKKKKVLQQTGELICEACGFDFASVYHSRGEGFIECHHQKPLSELKPGDKTHLKDLVLLCSNCHRMVHRAKPWLSISQLKKIIKVS